MIKSVATLALSFVLVCMLAFSMADGKGIVALAGYEHAVAMCDGEDMQDIPVHRIHGGYMYRKGGIMYTVNEGHMQDKGLMQLEELAMYKCAFYWVK